MKFKKVLLLALLCSSVLVGVRGTSFFQDFRRCCGRLQEGASRVEGNG